MSRIRMLSTQSLIERVTKAWTQIDSDHEYIHDAKFFEVTHRFTLATTLSGYIYLKTPTDKHGG